MTRLTGRGLAVTCRNLRQVYRLGAEEVVALDGIDLDVSPGAALAVVGPSGSGKSTLLAVLAGLLRPTSGQAHAGPYRLDEMSEIELLAARSADIGVIAQNPARNLLPYGDAEDNIRFAQRAAPGTRRLDLPSPAQLLAELGLTELAGRPVGRLSGGEQQRLAVAVAVATTPGLLLADEPTSQLDRVSRDRVVELLERVAVRFGATVIAVTHDPYVADALGRSIAIDEGRIRATLRAPATTAEPRSPAQPQRQSSTGPEAPVVSCEDVRYARGGRQILAGVSLSAGAGQVVAVLGPSGSGKSSLLALLAGLERPDSGRVQRDGRPVRDVAPDVGLVLQGYGLVSLLTAAENVAVALSARGIAAPEVRARVDDVLADVGLSDEAGHLVDELSGGQQQRVALARALVIRPRILFADEMTAELDHDWKLRILTLVRGQARRGAVVVLATHDSDTAAIADRRMYLEDGRLAAE